MRASPSLQLPSRVAAEIETPPQGSPDANAAGGAGDLGSVPGSGDSFAHAVFKQAARLRSAMWRGGERVRTPHPLPQRGSPSLCCFPNHAPAHPCTCRPALHSTCALAMPALLAMVQLQASRCIS